MSGSPSAFPLFPPSLYMKSATPATMRRMKRYFSSGYRFLPMRTPSTMTGIGLQDLPTTCVG